MSPGKIALAIIGSILGLLAAGLLAAGAGLLFAFGTQRTGEGFFTSPTAELSTGSYALVSGDLDLGAAPGEWFPSGRLATVRINVEDSPEAVFIGIGPEDEVDDYLGDVSRSEVRRIVTADRVSYRDFDGDAPSTPPSDQAFWAESVDGTAPQTLEWELEQGEWTVVIMNSDASPGLVVDLSAAARSEWLIPIGVGLLFGGLIFAVIAAVLLVLAVRRPAEAGAPGAPARTVPARYPVWVEGELDGGMSRWQWLFKWLLALPHYVVLAFLLVGYSILTIIAFFAILFTGRYPKGIFDFNVGVMRWAWRVSFYSYGVLGTDQYPPFTLERVEYPATLDVAYPEQLSRGLVLVKWWLLAIPHYIIVGLFTSGLVWWTTDIGEGTNTVLEVGGGIIGVLVFIAAIALLFTGRYPQGLFDLIMGLQRWVFRVWAYAGLMTDEYPPFRLDTGALEPPVAAASSPGEERST